MQTLLVLIVATSLQAGLQPRIHGPAQVAPGDFAILTASMTEGCLSVDRLGDIAGPPAENHFANLAWRFFLVDSDKQFDVRTDPHGRPQAVLVTGTKGTYTFLFVASDGQRIASCKHVLTVGATPPSPAPPGPGPGPNPSRFGATEAARQWAAEVPAAERSKGNAFAAQLEAIAKPVLDGAAKLPQELLDEMVAAANSLGPGWSAFRANLKAFVEKLIRENKLATSQDVAVLLTELAAGMK